MFDIGSDDTVVVIQESVVVRQEKFARISFTSNKEEINTAARKYPFSALSNVLEVLANFR